MHLLTACVCHRAARYWQHHTAAVHHTELLVVTLNCQNGADSAADQVGMSGASRRGVGFKLMQCSCPCCAGGIINIQGKGSDLLYEANVAGASARFTSLSDSTPWSDGEAHTDCWHSRLPPSPCPVPIRHVSAQSQIVAATMPRATWQVVNHCRWQPAHCQWHGATSARPRVQAMPSPLPLSGCCHGSGIAVMPWAARCRRRSARMAAC